MCMHSHTTALFIMVFLCMTMKPLSSTFSLSPIGQECESAKLQREKFEGARTKELKCEDMTAKSEEAKVRSCKGKEAILLYRLFASQLCTFAFTFFSLHNLMQVPYLSEICRRCYGVIALNAVWRPSCLL